MAADTAERFSWHYDVTPQPDDDWFDPLLTADTALYVDPFRIFVEDIGHWAAGHKKVMRFFNTALQLLADCRFEEDSHRYKKAAALLKFKEPSEFCLGVSKNSIRGAGAASGLQAGMVEGARTALRVNLEEFKYFEELAIFGATFGPDRISDVICNILKADFIAYTQQIARRHGIPLSPVPVHRASWSERFQRWMDDEKVLLPLNPYASRRGKRTGVILVPQRFLRRHPTVVPHEFFNEAIAEESEQLRNDLNYEVGQNVDQDQIAALARRRPRKLRAYLDGLNAGDPYDIEDDPDLVIQPVDFPRAVATGFNEDFPRTESDLVAFLDKLIENYRHHIENRGCWRVLWTNGKARREDTAQSLFDMASGAMCNMHDIDMSREADGGSGPVDFKFSHGSKARILLEFKFAKSSSFKANLRKQLATYAKAEGVRRGYFVIVVHQDGHATTDFSAEAEAIVGEANTAEGTSFEIRWVDARHRKSASKAV